jgi:COMPASS component SWD2
MSPQDDTFLSGATDDTVRLWDLRAQNAQVRLTRCFLTLANSHLRPSAQGLLNVAGHPCVAYDPSGFVFAVALNLRSTLLLYDLKNFDKQPFLNVQIEDPVLAKRTFPPRVPVYTSLAFSNDGKWLLVGTSGDVHYVVDAFEGGVVARLECALRFPLTGDAGDEVERLMPAGPGFPNNPTGLERAVVAPYERPMEPAAGLSSEEVKWTPDGRYVVSGPSCHPSISLIFLTDQPASRYTGSIDGKVHVWDVAPPEGAAQANRPPPGPSCTLFPLKSIEGHLGGPSRVVAFNPRTAMFASAGNDLVSFFAPQICSLLSTLTSFAQTGVLASGFD